MIYFDTSALIKAFVEEKGSDLVKEAINREKFVGTARITYVETYSGLNRKRRARELTEKAYRIAVSEFEARYSSWVRVQIDDRVLFLARDLTARHALRALDAIHLAAAMSLKSEIEEDVVFAAADRRLLDIAVSEGLTVWFVEKAVPYPTMIAVDSVDLHSVGYNPTAKKLYVQLRKTSKTYVYEGVDAAVFSRLLKSKAKEAFVNRFLEGRYRKSEQD